MYCTQMTTDYPVCFELSYCLLIFKMSGDVFLSKQGRMSQRLFFMLKLFRISLVVRRLEIGISSFVAPVSDLLI